MQRLPTRCCGKGESCSLGNLRVGFADPTDLSAYDKVVRLVKRDIALAVIAESQLSPLLEYVYSRTEAGVGRPKQEREYSY